MILTITPNPSLDLLFECPRLVWDDANRLDAPRRRPGGQGINVTRAARALGAPSVAMALLGGRVGDELERMLSAEGTPCERIDIAGETRVFVGARETETGRSLLLNPRGPQIDAQHSQRIADALIAGAARLQPVWVVCCGSVPPGLPPDLYARIGRAARNQGVNFVCDCDGEALRLAAPHATVLVPNTHEAERLLGVSIDGVNDAAQAARRLHELGARYAAITMGHEGALLSDGSVVWLAKPPRLDRGSAVGAGDAFLAALLVELDRETPANIALRRAVAAGSAVLLSSASDLLTSKDAQEIFERVEARPLD